MAANSLSFNAIGTLLSQIVSQATGKAALMPTNTSDFVAVAQTGLSAGYDNLMGSISQVLSRTIISNRPYSRHFKGLESDSIRWGNHVRKISYVDRDWEDGTSLPITNGVAVDDQAPTLDEVLQTNFYGQNDYQIPWTLYATQLNVAFRGPDEFASFISGKMQNISDMVEQKHEALARMALANLIVGIYDGGYTNQVVHLVTEYNTYVGNSPAKTLTELRASSEYPQFMKWVYGRIAALSAMLTERSTIYHANVTSPVDKTLARHTPYNKQNLYLLSSDKFYMESRVLADTFHDNYLALADAEILNFWQDINSPDQLDVTATHMDVDGTLVTPGSPTTLSNVFGVICDVEACGYTVCNQRSTSAAFNGKGEYQNFWIKFTDRYWNDFTENAIVFVLD